MSVWMACVWGLLGAGALEAHQLRGDIARVRNLPWRVRGELPLGPYLTALALRLALGVGLAAGFGASGQAGGPVGVMAVGVAAPKVLEQLAGQKVAELRAERQRPPAPPPPDQAEAGAGTESADAVEGASGERP